MVHSETGTQKWGPFVLIGWMKVKYNTNTFDGKIRLINSKSKETFLNNFSISPALKMSMNTGYQWAVLYYVGWSVLSKSSNL